MICDNKLEGRSPWRFQLDWFIGLLELGTCVCHPWSHTFLTEVQS
jgi:hypothetical protein